MPNTQIILLKDTIPDTCFGVVLSDRFGTGYGFTFDQAIPDAFYFQVQVFLQILKADSTNVLFEYRILLNHLFDKRIEDEGFYEYAYQLLLTSISEFDRHFKLKKSTLTMFKSYSPIPSFEQAKDPIRRAYLMLNFNNRASSN